MLPLTLKMFYFGICEVATDDVCHTTPMIIYLEIATMLCHNLLQILGHAAAASTDCSNNKLALLAKPCK